MTNNRREFLATTTIAIGAAVAGGVSLPVLAEPAPPDGPIDVGAIGEFKADGVIDSFAKSHKLFVITQAGKIYAPSSVCTHKFCVLKIADSELRCPCHGTRYGLDGRVTKGPAKAPLVRYGISEKQGRVIVDTVKEFDLGEWDEAGSFIQIAD